VPRKAIIATLMLGGLRVSEMCDLHRRHVDLAGGRLRVRGTKTDAADRDVDLLPRLRDELAAYKAQHPNAAAHDLVFPTSTGRPRDKHNVRNRVLAPAIEAADVMLAARGQSPLPEGLTAHKLRHSFASLLVALGHDPRHVMSQLGHADAKFTLELYAHSVAADERRRLASLVGFEWAPTGTTPATGASANLVAPVAPNAETAL
jgi:integrase